MKTLLAISTLLFVAAGCGTSENQQAERAPATTPTITTTILTTTTTTTTTPPRPISCRAAAEELTLQMDFDHIIDNPGSTTSVKSTVQSATEIHHETIEPGIRVCQIFVRRTASSSNRYVDDLSRTFSGILCTNASTWFWMGSDSQRKIVDEIEDCQILIDTPTNTGI